MTLATDVVFKKDFTSIVDMHLFISNYYQEFHPHGYNTKITIETFWDCNHSGNIIYTVRVERWGSCD